MADMDMEIDQEVATNGQNGHEADSSTRDGPVETVVEEASSTTGMNGENGEVVKYTYDESNMPLKALKFSVEADGYRYYVHPITQRLFSLDTAGYWYAQIEDGSYVHLEQASIESEKRAEAASATIVIGDDGYPIFPTNDNGQPILPKSLDSEPVFPFKNDGNPMFPYDHQKKKWCFPVDDKGNHIFPFNAQGKPIVPVDGDGRPIFPQDASGSYIFPMDKTNTPIPAMTVDGRSVVPYDEHGKPVIPKDKDGQPLIFMASDGVTPISKEDYLKWKEYYQEQNKLYIQQQQTANNYQAPTSVFHPLNIAQATAIDWSDVEMLQSMKRIRPEDVDLPSVDSGAGYAYNSVEGQAMACGQTYAIPEKIEDEATLKRKRLLAAQIKFTKKLGETKTSTGDKPSVLASPKLVTPPKPPRVEAREVKKSAIANSRFDRRDERKPDARRDTRDSRPIDKGDKKSNSKKEEKEDKREERSPTPPPLIKKLVPSFVPQPSRHDRKRRYSRSPDRSRRDRSADRRRSARWPISDGRDRNNQQRSTSKDRKVEDHSKARSRSGSKTFSDDSDDDKRVAYRSNDRRSNDRRSNDRRSYDRRSNDRRSNDRRSNESRYERHDRYPKKFEMSPIRESKKEPSEKREEDMRSPRSPKKEDRDAKEPSKYKAKNERAKSSSGSSSSSDSDASRSPSPKRHTSRKEAKKDDKKDNKTSKDHKKVKNDTKKRRRSTRSSSSSSASGSNSASESGSSSGSGSESDSGSSSSGRSRSRSRSARRSKTPPRKIEQPRPSSEERRLSLLSSEERRLRERLLKAYKNKTESRTTSETSQNASESINDDKKERENRARSKSGTPLVHGHEKSPEKDREASKNGKNYQRSVSPDIDEEFGPAPPAQESKAKRHDRSETPESRKKAPEKEIAKSTAKISLYDDMDEDDESYGLSPPPIPPQVEVNNFTQQDDENDMDISDGEHSLVKVAPPMTKKGRTSPPPPKEAVSPVEEVQNVPPPPLPSTPPKGPLRLVRKFQISATTASTNASLIAQHLQQHEESPPPKLYLPGEYEHVSLSSTRVNVEVSCKDGPAPTPTPTNSLNSIDHGHVPPSTTSPTVEGLHRDSPENTPITQTNVEEQEQGSVPPTSADPTADLPHPDDKEAYRAIYEKLKAELAVQKQECEKLKHRIERLKQEKKERKGIIRHLETEKEKFFETGTCALPKNVDGSLN